MEKALSWTKKAKTALLPVTRMIGEAPFWGMALFCFGLRVLVKQPLGSLLALVTGCIWVWKNMNFVKAFFTSFHNRMVINLRGYEKQSLWFEHGGRDKIKALIGRLTAQGVCFCNLVEHIKDLPPVSHWHAISTGLEVFGVTTQISGDTFYLSWKLQQQAEENNKEM